MSGMYSKLPHYVYLNKEKFAINTDYHIFIDFEEEMQGDETYKAIMKVLQRFYHPFFFDICNKGYFKEAIDKFIWFYKCGKPENYVNNFKNGNKSQIFSYKHDDLYIWAAFKQIYNVDLSHENIHWWKFRAMFISLPSNCEFVKIKGYRAYNGKDKNLLELKEIHKLPLNGSQIKDQIRRKQIYEALKQKSQEKR